MGGVLVAVISSRAELVCAALLVQQLGQHLRSFYVPGVGGAAE
jgi:hypothetical protein